MSRKGSFHKGLCLNLLCDKIEPHYHKNNNNTYEVGPAYSYASTNEFEERNKQAMLNAYVGINEKMAKKEDLKNAIKTYKANNRKRALKSLKNNNRRRKAISKAPSI